MMQRSIFFIVFLVCGCGVLFSGGYSYYDTLYFQKSPWIEKEGDLYYLKWVYGNAGFFFEPQCISKGNLAYCSLTGTSSSGALSGQPGEVRLSKPGIIDAIKIDNVFWIGQDNEKIKIQIIKK